MSLYLRGQALDVIKAFLNDPATLGKTLFESGNYPKPDRDDENAFNCVDPNEAATSFFMELSPRMIVSQFLGRYVPYGEPNPRPDWWLTGDAVYCFIALGALATLTEKLDSSARITPDDFDGVRLGLVLQRCIQEIDTVAQDNDPEYADTITIGALTLSVIIRQSLLDHLRLTQE